MKLLPTDMDLQQYADEFYFDGGDPKETSIKKIVYLHRDYFSTDSWLEYEGGGVVRHFSRGENIKKYCEDNNLDLRYK